MIPSQPPRGRGAPPAVQLPSAARSPARSPGGVAGPRASPSVGASRFGSLRRAPWLAALPSARLFGLGARGGWWPLFELVGRPFFESAAPGGAAWPGRLVAPGLRFGGGWSPLRLRCAAAGRRPCRPAFADATAGRLGRRPAASAGRRSGRPPAPGRSAQSAQRGRPPLVEVSRIVARALDRDTFRVHSRC